MKGNVFYLAVCWICLMFAGNVSSQEFDTSAFFERAKQYHLEDLKNYQFNTKPLFEDKSDTFYTTSNPDTLLQLNRNFYIKRNDVPSGVKGKIKSYRIDKYSKELHWDFSHDIKDIHSYEVWKFDTSQICYQRDMKDEHFGPDKRISRYNTLEDKTEEILYWNRFKDTTFVFETREIIKYDSLGRKAASIEFDGKDTNTYRFSLYKYSDVTTVSHYSKAIAMDGEILKNYEKTIIQYDERDNVIKAVTSYDTNIYVYDSLNRLQSQFYSETGFHYLLNYFYDGDNLVRVQGHHTASNDYESEIKYYGTKRITTTTDSENNVTKTLEEYDERGNCILQISGEYPEDTYIQIITIEYYE